MAGPMRRPMHGVKNTAKKGTLPRLLKMLFSNYKLPLLLILVCIIISAVGGSLSSMFLKNIASSIENKDWNSFTTVIIIMISVYLVAVIASFIQTRTGAVVVQGFLKDIRVKLFGKMQTLPIKYFDTHTHGDIMSVYTNDTDALRQLVSQSIPQIFSTILTISVMFFIIIYYSI